MVSKVAALWGLQLLAASPGSPAAALGCSEEDWAALWGSHVGLFACLLLTAAVSLKLPACDLPQIPPWLCAHLSAPPTVAAAAWLSRSQPGDYLPGSLPLV